MAFAGGGLAALLFALINAVRGGPLGVTAILATIGTPYAVAVTYALHQRQAWVMARWPHALLCASATTALVFRPRTNVIDWLLTLSVLFLIALHSLDARHLGTPLTRRWFATREPSRPIDWFKLFSPVAFLLFALVFLVLHYAIQPRVALLKGLSAELGIVIRGIGALGATTVVWLAAHVVFRGRLPREVQELFEPEPDSS